VNYHFVDDTTGMKVRERGCILPMAGSVAEVAAILAL